MYFLFVILRFIWYAFTTLDRGMLSCRIILREIEEISRKVYIVRPVSDRYLAAGGNLSYILCPMFRAVFIGQSYERIMRKERCQWSELNCYYVNDNGIEL